MTTIPSHLSSVGGPSPSRNPFARPKLGGNSSSSFTRKTLLPSVLSPVKSSTTTPHQDQQLGTPFQKRATENAGNESSSKARSAWRLLWRGGLEIGNEGWRLDGITFFALLSFPPPTPSHANKEINPFDVPIQPLSTPGNGTRTPGGGGGPQSPFPLVNGDTDLCLSLESMRGRKYLQVRGLIDLPSDELLEGEDELEDGTEGTSDNNNIQMSISPQAPLLASYFTGLLCRNEKLSKKGRTLNAILVGLGDEGIDSSNNSTVIIYGQKQDTTFKGGQGILKLCVGRRKPTPAPASAKMVKPGEPLPRAPLFFPAKAPKKPPPLFPSRSLSRTSSISSSIYQAPQTQAQAQSISYSSYQQGESSQHVSHAPVSGRTPGRRGEKRPRKMEMHPNEEEERRRKSGKIIVQRSSSTISSKMERSRSNEGSNTIEGNEGEEEEDEDEDIFGKRGKSITPVPPPMSRSKSTESNGGLNFSDKLQSDDHAGIGGGQNGEPSSLNKGKRVRVPQQVLDNKAAIRKQTLVLLENRGISRTHESFKDVFGMITKGTYFAFRDHLQVDQITKIDIHKIINIHLDMYLPLSLSSLLNNDVLMNKGDEEEAEDEDWKPEELVKLEEEVKVENYQEIKLEGTFLQKIHTHHEFDNSDRKVKVKLESVVEEEED